jgi:hypothetical protein
MTQLNHNLNDEPVDSDRQIDPEVEKAARQADVPTGEMYAPVDRTGGGSWSALAAVLVAVGVMAVIFIYFMLR